MQSDYKNDAEGQLYFQVRGAFSEFDKAKIKHNTMTGRYRKAQQGFVVKDSGLYGYDYDKDSKTYVINSDEAQVVQMIFDYFTDPSSPFLGINGIAHHLTEMGIPTAKGRKTWHRQVVRQILMNKSYTGTYYQNKYDTEGDYVKIQAGEDFKRGRLRPREEWLKTKIPRIIEDQQFDYTQTLLKRAKRRHANFNKHNYLLTGLVRCGRCGNTMTGRKTKSHGKDYYIYECRKNYAGAKRRGCGRSMSENKLNRHVWASVINLLDDPEKMCEYTYHSPKSNIMNEMKMVEAQIAKIKQGKKRLLTLVSMSEDIAIEEIKDNMKELQNTETNLQNKLKNLQARESSDDELKYQPFLLEDVINDHLINQKNPIDIENKQKILQLIIHEVVVVNPHHINIHTI